VNRGHHVGCEDLTAVSVKIAVFWALSPCISDTDRRFGETYRLHLQERRVSQATNLQNQAAAETATSMTEGFHGFPQPLQANDGIIS
jgi:hypothetical protein